MKERIVMKKFGINGEGIGYIHRKICFVNGVLPDEEVEIEIIENKPKYLKGVLKKIIKPSPYRVDVLCKENKECLGCSLMHLQYGRHLISKKQWIVDAINKYCHVEEHKVQDVIKAHNVYHYRQIVRLPIVYFNKALHVGIYQRDSHYLTLMENCTLQNKNINEVVKKILEIFNEHHLRDFHDKFKTGLRFLEMRCVGDQVQVIIICGKDGISQDIINEIGKIKQVVSVFYSINTSRYQDFRLEGYKKVYGSSTLTYKINNQKYICSSKSDFPIHLEMEEKKNEIVKTLIDSNNKVISINHGIGTLELYLDNDITAIDESRDHNRDAKENMKFLRKTNVEWIVGDIDKEVVRKCKNNSYDTLILNAVQREMNQGIKESLIRSKIKEFIYITPHYSTMAKEINELSQYFKIETIIPIDYQPYTSDILTILKMKRK